MSPKSVFFSMLGSEIADAMEIVGSDPAFAETEFDRFKAILTAGTAMQMLEFLIDVSEEEMDTHLTDMLDDAHIETMSLSEDRDFNKDLYQPASELGGDV